MIPAALSLLSWLWNHKLLALCIGLAIAFAWSRHSVSVLTIERDGYHAQIDAAHQERDLAQADAFRWQKASDLRDGAIQELTDKLKAQNDAIGKMEFSLEKANAAAAQAESQARDARAAFDQRAQELEAEAQKRPADVRELGPIVRERVGRLWE